MYNFNFIKMKLLNLNHAQLIGFTLSEWIMIVILFSKFMFDENKMIVSQPSLLSVVEVWRRGCYPCELRRVTKAGLRAILASPWYLDQPVPTHNWARYYTVWPLAFKGQGKTCVPCLVAVVTYWWCFFIQIFLCLVLLRCFFVQNQCIHWQCLVYF